MRWGLWLRPAALETGGSGGVGGSLGKVKASPHCPSCKGPLGPATQDSATLPALALIIVI